MLYYVCIVYVVWYMYQKNIKPKITYEESHLSLLKMLIQNNNFLISIFYVLYELNHHHQPSIATLLKRSYLFKLLLLSH